MKVHAEPVVIRPGIIWFALVPVALTFTGCVTRSYRLADKSVPPAIPLNLTNAPVTPATPLAGATSAEPSAAAPDSPAVTLHTVIVYRGPGSWKREAYWDEYVVSIWNRSEAPLAVTAASLHDGTSEPLSPGDNPWKIEKISKTWWQANALRQTGTYLALGAGTAAGLGAAWAASWGTMFGGTVSSGTAAAGAVGTAAFFALPVVAGGTVYMNLHRKHQVKAEFDRRRLVLPATIAPGQTAQGSLFFRVTPSPKQLVLHTHEGDVSSEAVVDLEPLSDLHIKKDRTVSASDPR